jgi:hypothetical protein
MSAESKVLRAAQNCAALKWNAAKRQRRRMDALMRARRRAEGVFKRGLYDRMLSASGLDEAVMQQRLTKDRATLKTFFTQRAAEAKRGSAAVRRRHREYLARLKHVRKNTPYSGPAPSVEEFLATAVDIEVDNGYLQFAQSATPWTNIAKVDFYADNDQTPGTGFDIGAFVLGQITWWFTWTPAPPNLGWLQVNAFLFLNGYLRLWNWPGCGGGGSAEASISSFVSITQLDAQENPFTDTSPPNTLLDESAHKGFEDSGGEIVSHGIDISDVITPQRFPLSGKNPVAISVTLSVLISAISSSGDINFLDKDFSASVPAVLVSIP